MSTYSVMRILKIMAMELLATFLLDWNIVLLHLKCTMEVLIKMKVKLLLSLKKFQQVPSGFYLPPELPIHISTFFQKFTLAMDCVVEIVTSSLLYSE